MLWKIESGDNVSPSYLFGTMHVDDARAFNFSDAVMPAIKACKNFALETHPDSTIIAYQKKIKATKSIDYLIELLSEDEFNKLKYRIKEISGTDLDSLYNYDADYLTSLLTPEDDKEDDKSTFVDAYLLGQAKTMGKSINGLETVDSQLNFFDTLSKEEQREYLLEYIETDFETYKSQTNILTDIYLTGDIYEIEKMVESYGGFDAVMESRNKVMSKSIQKLMKNGPTFSAVGAAHLPGKMGVIALLKESGYKVTRVEANFTGVADTYKVDISKAQWYDFTDTDFGYSLQLPGEPYKENLNVFDYYEYVELATKTSYGFYAMDIRLYNIEDFEVYINNIIEGMASGINGKILSSTKLKSENPLHYEFLMKSEDEDRFLITNVYINNGILYTLVAEDSQENINANHISKFFKSIKFTEPKPLPKDEITDDNILSDVGAFKIKMPYKPKKMIRELDNPYSESGEPYSLNMYISNNTENTKAFVFRYNDQPLGYHIANYQVAFNEMEENFKQKGKILEEPKTIYLDSIEGREYRLMLQDYHGLCRIYFRGNRTYLMLSSAMTEAEVMETRAHMDSFKFLPYQDTEISQVEFNNFSIALTGRYRKETDSSAVSDFTKDGQLLYASNDKTGAAYMFTYAPLKKYFKIDSKAEFYEEYMDAFKEWNDTVLTKETVYINKNVEAFDFVLKNNYTKVRSKTRIWLDNGHIYQYSVYSGEEDYNSRFTDSLLNSYKVTKPIDFDLFTSKSSELLTNLQAKDSLVFEEAKGALYYYPFNEDDLPAIYKAIKQTYKDDEDDYGAKSLMLSMFVNLSDENTVAVLDSVYQLSNSTTANKLEILTSLQSIEDTTAIKTYTRLLLNSPPNVETYTWNTFKALRDSVALAANNFQNILKLNSNPIFRIDVLEISKRLLENENYKTLIIDNQQHILQYALDDANSFMETDGYDYYSAIYSYLELFNNNAISSKNLDIFTEKLLQVEDNEWLVNSTLETRILNDLKTDEKLLEARLDSLSSRFTIMKALKKAGKWKSIPKKYLKPKDYTLMSVYHILDYEYEEAPSKIEILGEFNKEQAQYYAVKLDYDYYDAKYFAVVGPIKNIDLKQDIECFSVKFNWDGDTDESLEKNWKAKGLELLSSEDEE
ncbi:MAG TPA: TraB/GumN family protein [Flavobacteriaceae bacterium]|nr:TraB/GumN family protein [Flavobacteriaceae bacterium]